MKKNKKNKIFAVAVISAILCCSFCITSFAWSSGFVVLDVITDDSYSGYTKFIITDHVGAYPSSSVTSSFSCSYICTFTGSVVFGSSSFFYIKSNNQLQFVYNGVYDSFIEDNSSYKYVLNGGVIFIDSNYSDDFSSFLSEIGYVFDVFDPVQDIFDNVSQGVTGTLNIASSTASLLTTNTILSIMCVALPLVSFGVGLLIRLKERS